MLGSEGDAAGTWLWCWANQQMQGLPDSVTHGARSLKAFGEQRGVPELSNESFELGDVDGEFIAVIAAGALNAHCYVALPYDGGRAFAVVSDPSFPKLDRRNLSHAPTTFMTFLESRAISNHKKAWQHYLRFHLLEITEDGATIRGDGPGGNLIGTFDKQGRITDIEGEINNG